MNNKKARISYLEILILITSIFSFSYFIYNTRVVSATQPEIQEKCCEVTNSEGVCQDVLDESECKSGARIVSSKCEDTSFCKKICCYDEYEGIYNVNVPEILCQSPLKKDENVRCNLPGNKLGCCVLGDNVDYTNHAQCSRKSNKLGFEIDYRQNLNEMQCFALVTSKNLGACVFYNNECEFLTEQECLSKNGDFNEGYLCSAHDLNTSCKKTDKTTCVDGKDGVYFIDSCGNLANIYDSAKLYDEDYWSLVYSAKDSCNAKDAQGSAEDKECGNCNRFLGGFCDEAGLINPDYGDFICKDTSCEYNGRKYKNGEKWCVYENVIGQGRDMPGSEHFIYQCNYGEISADRCGDARGMICVQRDTILNNGTGEKFSSAACRVNQWSACFDLDTDKYTDEERKEKCDENPDCNFRGISLTEGSIFSYWSKNNSYFEKNIFVPGAKFNYCTPNYPIGFDRENYDVNRGLCSLANFECKVIYEKVWHDGGKWFTWECKNNCECLEQGFTNSMNDWCKSLGDCGGDVNYIGKFNEDGYSITTIGSIDNKVAPKLDKKYIEKLEGLINAPKDQKAEPGNMDWEAVLGLPENFDSANFLQGELERARANKEILDNIGMGAAGVGYTMGVIDFLTWGSNIGETLTLGHTLSLSSPWEITSAGNIGPVWSGISNALLSIGATSAVGMIVGWAFGLNDKQSNALAIASLGVGIGASIAGSTGAFTGFFSGGAGGCLASGPAFAVCAAVIVIIAAILKLIGIGDIKEVVVQFTCNPWQAPSGGKDCEKCNNKNVPCSEYKCESLGSACNIINKGTSEEMCVDSNPNDVNPPVMDPQYGFNGKNQKYSEITESGFMIEGIDKKCLDAYENVKFGIKTNEPAQCKWDYEMKDFKDMPYYLGTNSYAYNHSQTIYLPDPSHGQSRGINITSETEIFAKCMDTHGNIFAKFYEIEMCVQEGKDKIPPRINEIKPASSTLLGYFANSTAISIFTNEPAECKWDYKDTDYEDMVNELACSNNILSKKIYGYECIGVLNLSESTNKFYFRCKDQPWLDSLNKSEDRNVNKASQPIDGYILSKVNSSMQIEWVEPSKGWSISSAFTTAGLKVKTSGGIGESVCSYKLNNYNLVSFFKTGGTLHEQNLNLMAGKHNIYVECIDKTGDKANSSVEFEVLHDSFAPTIARVYEESGKIKIITTELSECFYSKSSCSFDFSGNETEKMSGSGLEHYALIDKFTLYIKCKDEFGNTPDECSIIVKASEFGM